MRLEALADNPIGFGELHADAAARTDEEWAHRWATQHSGPRLLARADDGALLGMAGGFVADSGRRVLFGVYVRPAARGQGVLEALVERVAAWAAPHALHLDVHVDNAPARAAYLRLGFVENGEITPAGGIDGRDLIGMTLPLQVEARSR
ncbi:MAG: Acetyltransferase [Frankiales bacterium]|nr:Acetyltransferase [Frankiales bacterium]